MDLIGRYQSKRSQYWSKIEAYFNALPPSLGERGQLLQINLTNTYSDSFKFDDIFSKLDRYPLLYLHFWLLDDLKFAGGADREQLERELLLVAFLSFAAIYVEEQILDSSGYFDFTYWLLVRDLNQKATVCLSKLFPGNSSFWDYYQNFWSDRAEAVLWEDGKSWQSTSAPSRENWLQIAAARFAPMKTMVAAVAFKTGKTDILPQLLAMMDRLHFIFQVRQDILAIRRDLGRGRYTYPIVKTMKAAGIPFGSPLVPEQVLGAMVLTGSIGAIGRESCQQIENCRNIARTLELPFYIAYFDILEKLTEELTALFSLAKKPEKAEGKRSIYFIPYENTLEKAIQRAEGYLLSDLTFRESWEFQRYTLLNMPEVIAQTFPVGTILKILASHGHRLPEPIDRVFRISNDCGFSYFNNIQILPDADELAVVLRLYPYSERQEVHKAILQKPLQWLQDNMAESGEIDVFFTEGSELPAETNIVVWKNYCLAVQINILLGLIDYSWQEWRTPIRKGFLHLSDRLLKDGVSPLFYYDIFYTLWAGLTLVSKISLYSLDPVWRESMERGTEVLLKRLAQERKRPFLTPQRAAFLILACLHEPARSLFDPNWVTILLKSQRYDGSWRDEPFYPTTHRGGGAGWYSSRSVTTAFCYHALKSMYAFHEIQPCQV